MTEVRLQTVQGITLPRTPLWKWRPWFNTCFLSTLLLMSLRTRVREQQRSDQVPASPGLQRPAVKVMEAGSPWAQRAQDHLGRMGTPQPAPSRRKGAIFRVGSRERRLGGEESVLFLSQACSYLAIPDSLPEAGLLLPLVFTAARAFLRRSSQPSRGLGRCLVPSTVRQSRGWCGRHGEAQQLAGLVGEGGPARSQMMGQKQTKPPSVVPVKVMGSHSAGLRGLLNHTV